MRIDGMNTVKQLYQTKSNYQNKNVNAYAKADDKLEYEISETAKSYSAAKTAVAQAPDVRADKIADIKARIAAGTYNVSAEDIAEKILGNAATIAF